MAPSNIDFFTPAWPLLHADNHLLVLYKPAGLLVQGDATGDATLLEMARLWIKERHGKPGNVFLAVVHRLDRPVAGIVVFARTSKAAGRLSLQFRSRAVEKRYAAVVEGEVQRGEGRLIHHLERSGPTARVVEAPTPASREARLSYRVLGRDRGRTLVEIQLETGRHHQIRAQMAAIGHPVVGDLRYGAPAPMPQRQIALFARELAFEHPVGKGPLHFRLSLPAGWPWPETGPAGPVWNWFDLLSFDPQLSQF